MGVCTLYRHYAADKRLLYVGISVNEIKRRRQHLKYAEWQNLIETVITEVHPSIKDALLAEERAIRTERPQFNIVHSTPPLLPIHVRDRNLRLTTNLTAGLLLDWQLCYVLDWNKKQFNSYVKDHGYSHFYDIETAIIWLKRKGQLKSDQDAIARNRFNKMRPGACWGMFAA